MGAERRTAAGSILRRFFDEQVEHLSGLFAGWEAARREEQYQAAEEKRIIETVVDASNTQMRAVSDYRSRLRPSIRALYSHVMTLSCRLPPPLNFTVEAFSSNPLVNALFANKAEISELLASNSEVQQLLARAVGLSEAIYALMCAQKTEKKTLGSSMQGELVVRDVVQETVNFSGHAIHSLCRGLKESDSVLRQFVLLFALRHITDEIESRKQQETGIFGSRDPAQRMRSLSNPEVYLTAQKEHLETACARLTLRKTPMRVSKLGIKLAPGATAVANKFDLYELCWGEQSPTVLIRLCLCSTEGQEPD